MMPHWLISMIGSSNFNERLRTCAVPLAVDADKLESFIVLQTSKACSLELSECAHGLNVGIQCSLEAASASRSQRVSMVPLA